MSLFSQVNGIVYEKYPNAGRQLTQKDVNCRVVRVMPQNGDYSFFPLKYKNKITAHILVRLECDSILLSEETDRTRIYALSNSWLDSNWLTVNEFIKLSKIQEPECCKVENDNPFFLELKK
ncbi:MAG: hypothetical protein ACK4HV_02125 [Parachlamydiaceae bacterium]